MIDFLAWLIVKLHLVSDRFMNPPPFVFVFVFLLLFSMECATCHCHIVYENQRVVAGYECTGPE